MDLQAARALKEEIARDIVRPRVLRIASEPRAVQAAGVRRVTGVQAGIALGIAAGAGEGDWRLAVRVQRRVLELDETLLARIQEAAGREADVAYIGTVFKGARKAGAAALERPWHQQRQRPLRIGASVGHASVTAGTLGAFGIHRPSGRTVMLSNNHVLANENKAKIGDAVLQPGAYDGGRRGADAVAELLGFVAIKPKMNNLVDAAVAALAADVAWDGATLTGIGTLAGVRTGMLVPGDRVRKVGRTTGVTHGVVTAIEVDDVVVRYERGEIGFDSQIEIESTDRRPFSAGGDSGSVIVDAQDRACALLFAGSDQGGQNGLGVTYANDLGLVLQALEIELTTRASAA